MIITAETILRKCIEEGNIHFNPYISAMKQYAQQFIEEAADLVDSWENSGQMRESLLEELNPQNI
jgi:hypothetical protein